MVLEVALDFEQIVILGLQVFGAMLYSPIPMAVVPEDPPPVRDDEAQPLFLKFLTDLRDSI